MRRSLAILTAISAIAAAADPAERLPDRNQEARARHLFQQTRCLVCQGQSIDDSEAELAADLRRIIREQVAAGRSDAEIRRFLTDRYGAFVLLRPPLAGWNWVLWSAPFVAAIAGLGWLATRRGAVPETPPLTAEEEARLARQTLEEEA